MSVTSVTVKDIMEVMEQIAPQRLAEGWDKPGLAIGDPEREVKKVLVALDVIEPVIEEAKRIGADMIITHHPMLLFRKIESITADNPLGKRIFNLIENGIAAFSAHTNLDIADGGTNDVLAELAGLENIQILEETSVAPDGKIDGIGRIGELPRAMSFREFAKLLQERLGLDSIRLVGDGEKRIRRVALCTGAGVGFLSVAEALGADAYLTGDIKYHEAQQAIEMGLAVADVTHYASEVLIVPVLQKKLEAAAKENGWDIEVVCSEENGQTFWHI